jgi:malic enzyme
MALRDSEVDVFLALAQQHTAEVLPLLYTPTVAQVPRPLVCCVELIHPDYDMWCHMGAQARL